MTRRRRTVLRYGIGVGVLVAVIVWFGAGSVGERLAAIDARLAMPSILGLVAIHLVAAFTWRRLTHRLVGARLAAWSAVRLWYAGQAIGILTPANMGADLYRAIAADGPAGRLRMAYPIVAQRITSTAALVLLGVAGASLLPFARGGSLIAAVLLVGSLAATAAMVIGAGRPRWGAWAARSRAIRAIGALERFGLRPPGIPSGSIASGVMRDGVGLGLVFHGVSLLLGLALVAAVDPAAAGRPLEVLGALAVARLSLAIPISPSGIGIHEAALGVLFVQLGLGPDVALASALLGRVGMLGTALVGAVALMAGSRRGPLRPRSAEGARTSVS